MSQPVWKFVKNLGDSSPLDHDGLFVYIDETGVYPPEAEKVVRQDESDDPKYKVYRFILEKCTFINGILSDNKYHPDHPAWWAGTEAERKERPQDTTYLFDICRSHGMEQADLVRLFCSDDPCHRAIAYEMVGNHHGFDNLDHEPMNCRRRELWNRYKARNGEDYGKRC